METIKIQANVDDSHRLEIKLPKHIRTGHYEMVLIIDNTSADRSPMDIMKYSGKIKSWPEDPVEFQRQLRSEWD